MTHKNTRRDFLKTSAAIGSAVYVASPSAWAAEKSPNERVRYACVGVQGKGKSDSGDAADHGDIVAICDVDERNLAKAARGFEGAAQYTDFRKMFDEMSDKFDAVTVSTPDHMHAVVAAMAMRNGKAIYCQKPLTRTVGEARALQNIARETGVATQMGNQGTSYSGTRKGAAVIQSGLLGEIQEVHVFTNRPIWAQGGERPSPQEAPSYLDWDLWLGVAPERPYADGYHPFAWRGWWDFGSGALGDMACHTFNLPFMGLDLRNPTSIQAETSGHNGDSFPAASKIIFEFPESDKHKAMKAYWYDKDNKPDQSLIFGQPFRHASGSIIVGDKATLYSYKDYGDFWVILTPDGEEVAAPDDIEYQESPGHFTELHQAITGERKEPPRSNIVDYSGPLTETILLGNLAVWVDGPKVEWDAENLRAKNHQDELDHLITPQYRGNYSL